MSAMWLRKETLEEFKSICRDEFGVELSDVDAHERAVAVLDLFSLLYLEARPEDELDPAAPGTLSAMYEDENVAVRPSSIEGLGLFAKRTFKTGETILIWHPKRLSKEEAAKVPEEQKRYLDILEDGTGRLMQIPERYVNHSEDPNTKMVGESDVAIRDIQIGEEITGNYL